MRINGESADFRLARGRTLEVGDARDWRVVCRRGVLWITQDRLPEDVILVPGQTFRLSRRGPTLIHAFEESEFRLEAAQRTWREGAVSAIRRVAGGPSADRLGAYAGSPFGK